MAIMDTWILDLSRKQKKDIGFQYDWNLEEFIYRFPVLFWRRKPTIWCDLGVDDNNRVFYRVSSSNGAYHTYYNANYPEPKIVDAIDRNIVKMLKKLGAKKEREKNDFSNRREGHARHRKCQNRNNKD